MNLQLEKKIPTIGSLIKVKIYYDYYYCLVVYSYYIEIECDTNKYYLQMLCERSINGFKLFTISLDDIEYEVI